MSTVSISGNLVAAPQGSASFPGGSTTFAIATSPDPKQYTVSTGGVKNLNSPTSYVSLDVGSGHAVTNADTLYLKSNATVSVRLTQVGGTAQVISLYGTMVLEFPPTALLTFLEVQGSATVEYFVSGQT